MKFPMQSIFGKKKMEQGNPGSPFGDGAPRKDEPPEAPGAYRFVDKVTKEKIYIGKSINLAKRKYQHVNKGKINLEKQSFVWQQAKDEHNHKHLDEWERVLIKKHKPSENQRAGGGGRPPAKKIKKSIFSFWK